MTADDLNGGLKQALVTAGGALSGENYLKLVTDDIPTSQIRNTLEGETVAYGVWIGAGTGGSAFDVDGKTLYATLRLDEIQLAAADGTGLLLALDDTTSNRELSAKLTNYENVAGDITYSGAGTVTVTNTGNDYTGRTYVKEGATVVLGGDNVLGQTALLQVTGEGSLVNLNGHQSIGQLDLGVANALTGKGSLTLVGNGKQSEIVGANTGLEADIVLSNDHTLIADDAASVGSKGLLTLNEGTQFTLSGATTGTLSKQLKGAGSVNIVNSTIALGANNSSFTGAWARGVALRLTPPRDLPAPGRRQAIYVRSRVLHRPVFLVNSRLGLFTAAGLGSGGEPLHLRAGAPSPEVTGPLCRVP